MSHPDPDPSWTRLRPPLKAKPSHDRFVALARTLSKVSEGDQFEEAVENTRQDFVEAANGSTRGDRQALLAAGLVLADLAIQGWDVRVDRGVVEVRPPAQVSGDISAEKARVRRQELLKRDAQLRQASVQKFLRTMERPQVFGGGFASIFSLMRDGRELTEGLRKARNHGNNGWSRVLASVVDPYIEFVTSEDAVCSQTGLRLMDVWRYFRHTWTNQHTSVPGRSMTFLVRDRAARFHPVMGIGALSSPIMQIRERDLWIGWHPDSFLARVRASPTTEVAHWLIKVLDQAIDEIYVDDLIEDGLLTARHLTSPDGDAIDRLLRDGTAHRKLHHRYVRSRDHKVARSVSVGADHWAQQARSHLFRSKRALALASYLSSRATLNEHFRGRPSGTRLRELVSTGQGSDVVRKVLKKAKADRVGIAVADVTVCGAIQPYNAVLGGKLVAMLAASPEVVLEYRRRYAKAQSEIASSMAGRPIIRKPNLVLLGTTSLYGVGSSQYNRIKVPCERIGGRQGESIHYEELGQSEAFGTSQYSEETVDALADLAQQSSDGQRVNSIFGEGVSPKMRKVRQGLDLLKLPSTLLLKHHRRRVVYAVSLVRNLREYLLGLETKPNYLVPLEDAPCSTTKIAAWWRERWLRKRINSDEVLEAVARNTLVRPIRHGARVAVPPPSDRELLFPDLS